MHFDIFCTVLPFWPFQVTLYPAGPHVGSFCSFWAFIAVSVILYLLRQVWGFLGVFGLKGKIGPKCLRKWFKAAWKGQNVRPPNISLKIMLETFLGHPVVRVRKFRWGREWVNESVLDEKALDREWVARESAIAGLLLPHTKLFLYIPQQGNIS